jgi:hypothetical protein
MDHPPEAVPVADEGVPADAKHTAEDLRPDAAMENNVDESVNTVTQSTIAPLPELTGYSNGQSQEPARPQTSYSDTGLWSGRADRNLSRPERQVVASAAGPEQEHERCDQGWHGGRCADWQDLPDG